MSDSVSERICDEELFDKFWEQLSWSRLEKKIRVGLRHPNIPFASEINCPAVFDLAKQIVAGIGESAINRAGEPVSSQETFSFDQRLVLMRILESIISEYTEWKIRRFSQGTISALRPDLPSLENK